MCNSDLAININGKSLSATILPILSSLGKTCSGRFQNTTDFTPQKVGYSYSFFAQRCHENIIYLQCYATYDGNIEIYNYDINAATWKYKNSTVSNSDLGGYKNIKKVRTLSTGMFTGVAGKQTEITVNVDLFDTANTIVVPKYSSWCTLEGASYPSKTSVKLNLAVLITSSYCSMSFYMYEFDKSPHM